MQHNSLRSILNRVFRLVQRGQQGQRIKLETFERYVEMFEKEYLVAEQEERVAADMVIMDLRAQIKKLRNDTT